MTHDLPLLLKEPPPHHPNLWGKGSRLGEPLTDGVLVQRAGRGDSIAFSELVNRHYRRAMRVAYGLLRTPQDAEHVVQEAFARLHARLPDFQGASAFYTWLYRIVVNLSIDSMRRRRRAVAVAVANNNDPAVVAPEQIPMDAGVQAPRRQLAARLQEAFAQLPEVHQAVLLLRELEGFSYDEIAVTLQVKKGTVMSRLFHARKAMQMRLQAELQDKKAEGNP